MLVPRVLLCEAAYTYVHKPGAYTYAVRAGLTCRSQCWCHWGYFIQLGPVDTGSLQSVRCTNQPILGHWCGCSVQGVGVRALHRLPLIQVET
jgi:hypothetical protein